MQRFGVFYFSELDSVNLEFLKTYLVKRGRFPSAAAEKAWGNFDTACRENIKDITTELRLPRSDAFHLCMKVFQRLIDMNYCKDEDSEKPNQANVEEPVTTIDREILHFIGGSIVHSLKQKMSQIKQNKQTSTAGDARLSPHT